VNEINQRTVTDIRGTTRGFTLLEILISLAILGMVFSVLGAASSLGAATLAEQPDETHSAHLVKAAVLNIEEEYRTEGFPDNEIEEDLRCEIPSDFDNRYVCRYDLEKLDIDVTMLNEMVGTIISSLQEKVGPEGNILLAFRALAFLFVKGNVPISPLCPATPGQFLTMCNINTDLIQNNVYGMLQFFPQVILQAAEQTRKLRVRILRDGKEDKGPLIEIETFIVSVPESIKALQEEGAIADPTANLPATPTTTPTPSTKSGGSK
jgi:prepilin-type N-terminal cleavage/methylation domain-containing protein